MNNLQGRSPISIGIVSLITVFCIVMLTSFAVLIITGARTDSGLSDLAADSVTEYYVADAIAEERFMQIYNLRAATAYDELPGVLTDSGYTVAQEDDRLIVGYSVPINDIKILNVELGIPPDTSDAISRLVWQATPTIQQ